MPALKDKKDKFGSFIEALGPAARVYTRLVAKTVAVRCTPYIGHSETWAIVAGEIRLGALPNDEWEQTSSIGTVVSTPSVIARRREPHDVLPGKMERTLADIIEAGRLPMFSPGALLAASQDSGQEDVDFHRLPRLTFLGERVHLVVGDKEGLTAELQARAPYESFDDLMDEMGFADGGWRDRTEIAVTALPIADFHGESAVTNGMASVRFRLATSADPKLLRLGWRVLANNDEELVRRDTVTGDKVALAIGGGVYEGSVDVSLAAGQAVRCWLNYGGVKQGDPIVLRDPRSANPRYALHELLDQGGTLLTDKVLVLDLQKGQQRDSRAFELGVSHLLHLLGFQTQHYAKPLTNAPDIIAYTRGGDAMIVECSLTSIASDSSKATWLQERVSLARSKLEAISNGAAVPEVLGVAVVAFDDADAGAAEAQELSARGIATVCISDLRRYLSLAAKCEDAHEKVFADLVKSARTASLGLGSYAEIDRDRGQPSRKRKR